MPRKRKETCIQCGKSFKLLKSHIKRSHPIVSSPVNSYQVQHTYADGVQAGRSQALKEFDVFNRKLSMMEHAAHAIDAAAHAIRSIAEVK